MTRALFLDFDGVINNDDTWGPAIIPDPHPSGIVLPIDPRCIAQLNDLVARSGAKVVISSSWRKFADWTQLAPALARQGFVGEVIDETPDLIRDPTEREAWRARDDGPVDGAYEKIERGMEIWVWLSRHPEVTEFVILDDDADMWRLRPALVLTDPKTGLTAVDVETALVTIDASGGLLARLRKAHNLT